MCILASAATCLRRARLRAGEMGEMAFNLRERREGVGDIEGRGGESLKRVQVFSFVQSDHKRPDFLCEDIWLEI